MTTPPRLLVLGPPAIDSSGGAARLDRKPLLLLAWLALSEGPVSRSSLADLLWPDSGQPGVNLRKALTEIRLALGAQALAEEATGRSLALGNALWVDVKEHDRLLDAVAQHGRAEAQPCPSCQERLAQALGLWRGSFMEGFRLPETPDLDPWLALHRQRLDLRRLWALDQLAQGQAALGHWREAIDTARRRVDLDPLDELGHRRLAQLLAWSGQRVQALRQLERCAGLLAQELGLEPEPQTLALASAIRRQELPDPPRPAGDLDPAASREAGAGRPLAERLQVIAAERQEPSAPHRQGRQGQQGGPRGVGGQDAQRAARGKLLAAILHPETELGLSEESLSAVAELPPVDLTTYRLSRVAAWSLPRYRLDRHFVALSLLVDLGRPGRDRWRREPRRFQDLREVLSAVPDPALVLLGRPGAGKSTLLRRLELDLAAEGLRGAETQLPFLVPLSAYRPDPGQDDPGSWLEQRWQDRYPALPPLAGLLAEGRMLLLLDGLNELPHRDEADQLVLVASWRAWLLDLVERTRGNRVVFSCRHLDYSAPLSSTRLPVPQVQLEPLSSQQARDLVASLAGEEAPAALARLEQAPDGELLRTPYALRLFVDQVLAGEPGSLDWVALQVAMLRRALRRELERGNPAFLGADPAFAGLVSARDRRRLLQARVWVDPYALPEEGHLFPAIGRLAWAMQAGRHGGQSAQVRLSHTEALAALADPAAEGALHLGHDLGILEDDAERDEVAFSHQLLQEHFAARRLAKSGDLGPLAQPWRADALRPSLAETLAGLGRADPLPPPPGSGWEETALQALALTADPVDFIRRLLPVDLVLAARCALRWRAGGAGAADAPGLALFSQLRQALVDRAQDRSADLRARIAAGLVLGELGDPRMEPHRGPLGPYLVSALQEVPAGPHRLGPGPSGSGEVNLPAFGLARLEVTNAEWTCFMAGGGYDDARWWDTSAAAAWREGLTTSDDTRAHARTATARFRSDPAELDRLLAQGHMPADWHAIFRRRIAMDEASLEEHLKAMYPGGPLRAPRFWEDPAFNNPAQPVVGICWYEARAYTLWLAAQTGRPYRLPTELEWEAAARRRAPLPTPTPTLEASALLTAGANCSELHLWRPSPVGVFAEGDTPEGISDLCGNVWEWTSSIFGPQADQPLYAIPRPPGLEAAAEDPAAPATWRRVARGGAWDSPHSVALPWVRDAVLPGGRDAAYGMRVGCG